MELSARAVAVVWQLRLYLLAQETSWRVLGSDVGDRVLSTVPSLPAVKVMSAEPILIRQESFVALLDNSCKVRPALSTLGSSRYVRQAGDALTTLIDPSI